LPLHIIFVHIIFTSVVIEPTQTWQKPWKRNHAQQLIWPTLEERRKKPRLALLYKVANGEVKIDAGNKLIPPDRLSRHTNAHSFQIPYCKTSIRKESFYP